MDLQRQQQWQKILQLTQQMYDLAVPNTSLMDLSVDAENAKQPWLLIAEIEATRLGLLEDFFSKEVSVSEADELRTGIQQIQSIDQKLRDIGLKVQQEIGAVFSQNAHSKRAVSAYSSNKE